MANSRDRDRGSRPVYEYRERSLDSLKQRAERSGGRYDSIYKPGFDTWKPAQGDNLIRFLPPTWDKPEHYGLNIFVHGYIGPDQGSYLCIQKMQGKPCPICQASTRARTEGDEEEAKKLNANERVLTWIIDRDGDDAAKPLLFQLSWTMDRDIAALCHDRRTHAALWIDQPDVGYDVAFQRTGTGMKLTRYFGYQIAREASPIAEDMRTQDAVMQYILDHPLPTVLQYYPAEYLAKALLGTTHAVADNGAGKDLLVADDEEDSTAAPSLYEDETEEEEEAPAPEPQTRRPASYRERLSPEPPRATRPAQRPRERF